MRDVIARNEFAEAAGDLAARAEQFIDETEIVDAIQPWTDTLLELNDKYNSIILHTALGDDALTDAGKVFGATVRVRKAVVELYNALYDCASRADAYNQKYGRE